MMPSDRDTFFATFDMWSEKVSFLCSISPRYRKESTIGIGMSLIKIGIVHEGDLDLGAIIMALHIEKLIVCLLADDHCSVLSSNLFALAFSLSRLITLITRQVSSANKQDAIARSTPANSKWHGTPVKNHWSSSNDLKD